MAVGSRPNISKKDVNRGIISELDKRARGERGGAAGNMPGDGMSVPENVRKFIAADQSGYDADLAEGIKGAWGSRAEAAYKKKHNQPANPQLNPVHKSSVTKAPSTGKPRKSRIIQ